MIFDIFNFANIEMNFIVVVYGFVDAMCYIFFLLFLRPLEENIGRYTYILEAMDSEGKTVTDTIMIHVQQARQARNYNHRFTATFKLEKKYEYDFVYSLDWQVSYIKFSLIFLKNCEMENLYDFMLCNFITVILFLLQIKAVEKIANAYQDTTTDHINVRSITLNPIKLTWTNTSLTDPKTAVCPSDELEALAEVSVLLFLLLHV